MSIEMKRKAVERKWEEFKNNLGKMRPDAFALYAKAVSETIELWKRVGMYIGEEQTQGVLSLGIGEDFRLKGTAFEAIYKTAILKVMLDKLEEELKWFKENREILEDVCRGLFDISDNKPSFFY